MFVRQYRDLYFEGDYSNMIYIRGFFKKLHNNVLHHLKSYLIS